MWISIGDTIVSSPWPLYCRSHQMTSQWSRIIPLRWLTFRDSSGHCKRCFVTNHPMTLFWFHFKARYKATVMMESQKDNHVKGTKYIVTSLSDFSQATASVCLESRNDGHLRLTMKWMKYITFGFKVATVTLMTMAISDVTSVDSVVTLVPIFYTCHLYHFLLSTHN